MSSPEVRTQPGFYVVGGTVQRGAPCYVVRGADRELHEGLCQGRFCYVLTSRQTGKSSLMVRTAAKLREAGFGVAVLDLTAIGQNLNPEQWYGGLLSEMDRRLSLDDQLLAFWTAHPNLSPLQRWMRAVREVILPRFARIVIFIDEIDAVRSLPFSTDEFFAGIRDLYNGRAEDPDLERLSICLLGVATPSDLVREWRTTPFNIGQRVELRDFTAEEASALASGLGREEKLSTALLRRVLYWTAGHPYLTQRLCQAIANDPSVDNEAAVDEVCAQLFFSRRAREQDDNLLFVRERILRTDVDLAGLLSLYGKVYRRKSVMDQETDPLVSALRLSGIVRAEGRRLVVRNRIYARVFDSEWVRANMPDAEVRRQRAAYRRGVLRATAAAAAIMTVIGWLGATAYRQAGIAKDNLQRANVNANKAEIALAESNRQKDNVERQRLEAEVQRREAVNQRAIADQQRDVAEEQKKQADLLRGLALEESKVSASQREANRQLLYAAEMNLAMHDWDSNSIDRMKTLLRHHVPKKGEVDLRRFEWYYLWKLCHTERTTLKLPNYGGAVAFSPDGKLLAIGTSGAVQLRDVATLSEVATLKMPGPTVRRIAFSPDGKLLLGVDNYFGNIRLWDLTSRREIATWNAGQPSGGGGFFTRWKEVRVEPGRIGAALGYRLDAPNCSVHDSFCDQPGVLTRW